MKLGDRRSLRVRYQRRRMSDVGFPDFAQPYFFNATSLPFSNLDKLSARYEAQAVTPWLANLSLTAYYQRQDRLLQNLLPVQFPAPTAVAFFPISVMRLDVLSRTEQRVWTPGVDLQAVLRARDASSADDRPDLLPGSQQRSAHDRDDHVDGRAGRDGRARSGAGGVPLAGAARPGRRSRIRCACPTRGSATSRCSRRTNGASGPQLSIVAGLRGDFYAVTVEADARLRRGPGDRRRAARDRSLRRCPTANGADYARHALTGDIGLVANPDGRVNPFIRFGRSYRHPNLEEMLFAGPATAGSIAPNIAVRPEKGNNFDAGAKFRLGHVSGGAYVFFNRYEDFIAQDLVVATTPAGPLAQATNFADVRIIGHRAVGGRADRGAPRRAHAVGRRGADARDDCGGHQPGGRLVARRDAGRQHHAGEGDAERAVHACQRAVVGRVRHARAGARVARGAQTVLDSPFLIAQDLLSLDGFAVQRIGWGVDLTRGRDRASVVVRRREPDGSLLPRALPVCAGARTELDGRAQRRRVLGAGPSHSMGRAHGACEVRLRREEEGDAGGIVDDDQRRGRPQPHAPFGFRRRAERDPCYDSDRLLVLVAWSRSFGETRQRPAILRA